MKYRAIENFCDKQDDFRVYGVGDEFPRSGLEVSEERIQELATDANALGKPLIEKVEVAKTTEEKAPAKKTARKAKKE